MKSIQGLRLVSMLFMLALGLTTEAQTVSGPPNATAKLSDLIVKEIVFAPSPSKIMVRVLNQGTAASSKGYLALMSEAGDNPSLGTKQRVWTIEVPALEPGKEFSNSIDVSPLTQTHGPWKAVVDRSNTVKESNEANNQLTYPATPKIRLPDLLITRAVLIDATTGEVSVEVSNTETGTAKDSTLRLIVWKVGKFEKEDAKTVFVKVPSIGPLKKTNVKIKAGVPIISTRFSLYIDIGEEVKERNENNNRYEGDAGKS